MIRRLIARLLGRPASLHKKRCQHDWRYTGPTGTGWLIARCTRCNETDLAS